MKSFELVTKAGVLEGTVKEFIVLASQSDSDTFEMIKNLRWIRR